MTAIELLQEQLIARFQAGMPGTNLVCIVTPVQEQCMLQVKVATSQREKNAEGRSNKGLHWQIPTLLGKCKEGSDRNRIQCMIFDFVIHPDTCRMAMNNAHFKVSA